MSLNNETPATQDDGELLFRTTKEQNQYNYAVAALEAQERDREKMRRMGKMKTIQEMTRQRLAEIEDRCNPEDIPELIAEVRRAKLDEQDLFIRNKNLEKLVEALEWDRHLLICDLYYWQNSIYRNAENIKQKKCAFNALGECISNLRAASEEVQKARIVARMPRPFWLYF